jgi:hypothetical protein
MNSKLLVALLGLLAVSTASASLEAASEDGSLPADIAAIPLCSQVEQADSGNIITKYERKQLCQNDIKAKELLTIDPKDTATLKAMCSNAACTTALTKLYQWLPNCRYRDWAFRVSVENKLQFCGIDPLTVAATSGSGANDTVPTVGTTNSTTKPPVRAPINISAPSSSSGSEFAPIGVTPSPVPSTEAPTSSPPATKKSASSSVFASTAAAVIVVAAAAVAL